MQPRDLEGNLFSYCDLVKDIPTIEKTLLGLEVYLNTNEMTGNQVKEILTKMIVDGKIRIYSLEYELINKFSLGRFGEEVLAYLKTHVTYTREEVPTSVELIRGIKKSSK